MQRCDVQRKKLSTCCVCLLCPSSIVWTNTIRWRVGPWFRYLHRRPLPQSWMLHTKISISNAWDQYTVRSGITCTMFSLRQMRKFRGPESFSWVAREATILNSVPSRLKKLWSTGSSSFSFLKAMRYVVMKSQSLSYGIGACPTLIIISNLFEPPRRAIGFVLGERGVDRGVCRKPCCQIWGDWGSRARPSHLGRIYWSGRTRERCNRFTAYIVGSTHRFRIQRYDYSTSNTVK